MDTITDFTVSDDTIQLDNSVYSKLATPGVLAASWFIIAPAAATADDYIVYNPTTGSLLYDADGNGAGAAVQIARTAQI